MESEGEATAAFSGCSIRNCELLDADSHLLELRQSEEVVNGDIETAPTITRSTNAEEGEDLGWEDVGVETEEEEEGEDDDVENEEGDEEGGYRFRFSGDMDPLSFTKQNSSGLQPYEQFERLEHQYQELLQAHPAHEPPPQPQTQSHPPPSHLDFQVEALARAQAQARHSIEKSAKKPRLEDVSGATMEEIMEVMNFSARRRSRKHKNRGRRKGSRSKGNPEVTRKLGDATLHYALGRYEEAIGVFYEVIRLSPNVPDPYHRLGLIYSEMGDKKRAMDFYMIAAHLTPKDASLWKILVTWSIEQGDRGQAKYCLSKALTADPEDINLQFHRASLYVEYGDYLRAAESYEQIYRLCPDNVEAVKTSAQLYKKCGQQERAVNILESFLRNCPGEADLNVVDMLASLHMDANAHLKALELIEKFNCSEKEMPLYLVTKAGICNVYLGNMEKADAFFGLLRCQNIYQQRHLIFEVGDSLMNHGRYESALEYYTLLAGDTGKNNGYLHMKIAECYCHLKKRLQSIDYFYKALDKLENHVDARLALASLLLEESRDDEAICVLSPPKESESRSSMSCNAEKPWWLDGKIKLKLSQIYKTKGLVEDFVDVIFPVVRETLFIETIQQKFRPRKRVPKSVLSERIKILGDDRTDTVFHKFRPVALSSDLSKASRAKKLLRKKETAREAKRAAALAAGIECMSGDSEDDLPQQAPQEPPLPNLLKDVEHHSLLIDLCKGLSSLKRYWEALEILNLTLKLASNYLTVERKEEFRTLGAQIAYNIADPAHGWAYARHMVNQRPYSFAAWNCYYKVISKLDTKFSKHRKFLHSMRRAHEGSVPVMLIFGHQFTMISQHQAAASQYLSAHKQMPDVPLINLCAGTALINLSLGLRLQNKHQTIAQGLAFLHNNLRICRNSQESLYNIARAFHHVGLLTLAAANYEKVLAMRERDYPVPTLPSEEADTMANQKPGYCDLRREAAYNLHLIYKKSGAIDLARQVLRDYCVT